MPESFIINLFTAEGFAKVLGWSLLFLEFVYLVSAFIITREVSLMNKSFKTEAAFLFTLIANIHFFIALGIFIVSLMLLL